MATSQELQAIVRTLNKVRTAGQVRAAIGAALKALGKAYPLLGRLSREREKVVRRELDGARLELERWFPQVKSPGEHVLAREWASRRRTVERAYIVIGGLEAEADAQAAVSLGAELAAAIPDAPRVALEAAGRAVGAVANTAGAAAGGALRGILGGLGPLGLLVLAVVIVLVARAKGLVKV